MVFTNSIRTELRRSVTSDGYWRRDNAMIAVISADQCQRLLKFLDRTVELVDPARFNLVALQNVRTNRGDDGIGSQNLVIVVHARCPYMNHKTVARIGLVERKST